MNDDVVRRDLFLAILAMDAYNRGNDAAPADPRAKSACSAQLQKQFEMQPDDWGFALAYSMGLLRTQTGLALK